MASGGLEAPPGEDPDWADLYTAREDEVPAHRPILTGDVYEGVSVTRPAPPGAAASTKKKALVVLQHPCTMRGANGELRESLLVATLRDFPVLPRNEWDTNEKCMPLPDVRPSRGSVARNQGAFFESLALVHPEELKAGNRVACLSEVGVYIALQRWIYHSSRLVVPVWNIEEANSHVFAEAELGESWAETAIDFGVEIDVAAAEFNEWLSAGANNQSRRDRLKVASHRSAVQREMKQELKSRYGEKPTPTG